MDLVELRGKLAALEKKRGLVWDALWGRRSIGRMAVAVVPSAERLARAKEVCAKMELATPKVRPAGYTEKWEELLRENLANVVAGLELPGDAFLALEAPRTLHGESQGFAEVFGARVELQPDGHYFVHPLAPDPAAMATLRPRALEESLYWRAVELIRYARAATAGVVGVRSPVMTSSLDTANYLLGTTVLMDWIYTEPEALHALLATVTDAIARMILELHKAAGGRLEPLLVWTMRGGFALCSECRALISVETYEEFEAPYLHQIGERCGPFIVHSCGSWERSVPSTMREPAIRAMNGGSKESDVAELCRLAKGGEGGEGGGG